MVVHVFYSCRAVGWRRSLPRGRAEVSGQLCAMPGTSGTSGLMPDTPPVTATVACLLCVCVCVCGLPVESGAVRRGSRSRLSSSDSFTRRQGATCACLSPAGLGISYARRPTLVLTCSPPHLSPPGHRPPLPRHPISPQHHHPLQQPAGNPPAQPAQCDSFPVKPSSNSSLCMNLSCCSEGVQTQTGRLSLISLIQQWRTD